MRRGRVLRHVQQDPHRQQVDQQRRPAVADEGQRDAFRRQKPEHHADVHECLRRHHRGQADREKRAESIGRAHCRPQAAPRDDAEARQDHRCAREPQLLRDHRVDEVGVRLRQIEQFLHPRHQPAPEHAARPDGDQRLNDLKSVAQRVVPGVEK